MQALFYIRILRKERIRGKKSLFEIYEIIPYQRFFKNERVFRKLKR